MSTIAKEIKILFNPSKDGNILSYKVGRRWVQKKNNVELVSRRSRVS